MLNTSEKKVILFNFARYMAGRYRLGYGYLALYWAAVLFEEIIWQKSGLRQGLDPEKYPEGKEPNLYGLIKNLNEETLREDSIWRYRTVFPRFIFTKRGEPVHAEIKTLRDVRTRLDNFRYLRNSIMHGVSVDVQENEFMPHNCDEFVCYVWSELASDSFVRALEEWHPEQGGRPIQTLSRISADYMIRTIDETNIKEPSVKFEGITVTDFENLFCLRDKLLGLKDRLSLWLSQNTPHLDTDILTTIDTTSAYIWMPLVQKQKKEVGDRKGIWDCSVSILGTPLDLRIYLEFGGRARNAREYFYRFLGSEEYRKFSQQQMFNQGWQLFDVDWYSALFNVRPLDSWQSSRDVDIAAALVKLPPREQLDSEPITWNRLSHGFIIWKNSLADDEEIEFNRVITKLERVIALHEEFTKFCHKEVLRGELS